MEMKISLISSSAVYMGCLWPSLWALPGTVMSSASASSRSSRAFSARTADCCSMADSTSARTALASWPMTGRSSAESLPICFRTAVSSPFLPRYWTRRASSSPVFPAAPMAASAPARMASSCSFIVHAPYIIMLHTQCSWDGRHQKNASHPIPGTKGESFRGTTRIHAACGAHSWP